ncbi:glycoside hydrolase family 3 N-terminal domain-containing protein [Deinococcus sp.]|uniref:glycoside hydrolase family 3 N-terminal domain-containing protein n=1 Tax=Deinococcus sp. TaxID=47478 RepID=UPI00286DFD0B|nr:glycoside hydrolase family 3 N-terminal domain-containing protein [Deinococcus sp.]
MPLPERASLNRPIRAARTLIIDLPGPDLDVESASLMAEFGFGGVCLFTRNVSTPERTSKLVRDIRDVLGPEILIGIDQEGGAVLRRLDVPLPPAPMGLSAAVLGEGFGNEAEQNAAAHEAGAIAARGLAELGINWNYAPCLDVNIDPANPVIGERSFGADPQVVARLGVAWALGCESAGVLSAVKHFPGHGDTAQDSHLTLPTVDKSRAELEATEWLPFRAAVRAGVGSVMTAHIVYPALDPELPATLSPAVLSGLLRRDWGYDGVVVTDATDMRAIRDRYPNGQAGPLALSAGADAALSCGHGDHAVHREHAEALERALANGSLPEARLREALGRLARAAQQFPGLPRPYPEAQRQLDQQQIDGWARASVTRLGAFSPMNPGQDVLLLVPEGVGVGGPYGEFLSGEALSAALKRSLPHLHTALLGVQDTSQAQFIQAQALLAHFPDAPVMVATTDRWQVPPSLLSLVPVLQLRNTLHLAVWNPYLAVQLPFPALITYGFQASNLEALRHTLISGEIRGRLPF